MPKDNDKPFCDVQSCWFNVSQHCALDDTDLNRFARTIPPINHIFPKAAEMLKANGPLPQKIHECLLECRELQYRVLDAIEKIGFLFPELETFRIEAARHAIETRIKKAS